MHLPRNVYVILVKLLYLSEFICKRGWDFIRDPSSIIDTSSRIYQLYGFHLNLSSEHLSSSCRLLGPNPHEDNLGLTLMKITRPSPSWRLLVPRPRSPSWRLLGPRPHSPLWRLLSPRPHSPSRRLLGPREVFSAVALRLMGPHPHSPSWRLLGPCPHSPSRRLLSPRPHENYLALAVTHPHPREVFSARPQLDCLVLALTHPHRVHSALAHPHEDYLALTLALWGWLRVRSAHMRASLARVDISGITTRHWLTL